jgi:hypothetical protein
VEGNRRRPAAQSGRDERGQHRDHHDDSEREHRMQRRYSSIDMTLLIAYRTMGYPISTHGVD